MKYEKSSVERAITSIRMKVMILIFASVALLVLALLAKNRLGGNDVSSDQTKTLYLVFVGSMLISVFGFWLAWFVANLGKWVSRGKDRNFGSQNLTLSKDAKSIKRLCRLLGNTWIDKEAKCLVFDGLLESQDKKRLKKEECFIPPRS